MSPSPSGLPRLSNTQTGTKTAAMAWSSRFVTPSMTAIATSVRSPSRKVRAFAQLGDVGPDGAGGNELGARLWLRTLWVGGPRHEPCHQQPGDEERRGVDEQDHGG